MNTGLVTVGKPRHESNPEPQSAVDHLAEEAVPMTL